MVYEYIYVYKHTPYIYIYIYGFLCSGFCPMHWGPMSAQNTIALRKLTLACPYNHTTQGLYDMWSLLSQKVLVIFTTALNVKFGLTLQRMGGYSSWQWRGSLLVSPRSYHNRRASLAILSLIDNAVMDGIIWPSEKLSRRLCWHLRFILILSCRFYNEHCNKVCQRIITYLIKS
jgi:hypothetical protein